MSIRYHTVFISSTYIDLRKERHDLLLRLLRERLIPIGMELWPVSTGDLESAIYRYIDASDFYVVFLKHRYGTVPQDETRSYTELEYNYATRIGKPTMVFTCNYGTLTGEDEQQSIALNDFKKRLQESGKEMRRISEPAQFPNEVCWALSQARLDHPQPGLVVGRLPKRTFVAFGAGFCGAVYAFGFLCLNPLDSLSTKQAEEIAGILFLASSLPSSLGVGVLVSVMAFETRTLALAGTGLALWLAAGITGTILCILILGSEGAGERLFGTAFWQVLLFGMFCVLGALLGARIGTTKWIHKHVLTITRSFWSLLMGHGN